MARNTPEVRKTLAPAVPFLREQGKTEWADALESVLAYGGWSQLRETEGTFTTNIPLTIRLSLREDLEAAAGRAMRSLSSIVAEGHRRVLEGSWTPPEPAGRTPMAAGDKRVVLNVTVPDELRRQLQEALPGLRERLGYRAKVTEGGIAVAYLKHTLLDAAGPEDAAE